MDVAETDAERFRKLGNEQFKAGENEKAINLYTESLEKVKGWEAFSNRAAASLKLSKFSEALNDCAQLMTIEENNLKGLFRMAQSFFFGLKQSVDAILMCQSLLKAWPGNPDVIKLLNDINLSWYSLLLRY